jgi:formate dehydrogenase subunit gamma
LTWQSSTPGRWLLDRPVKPGDDSTAAGQPNRNAPTRIRNRAIQISNQFSISLSDRTIPPDVLIDEDNLASLGEYGQFWAQAVRDHATQMSAYEWWSPERASEIISQHSGKDGPLLPVLQALQEAFGSVPEAAVVMVAEALNLSRAEVHGVVTFYHDFRREPAGRRILKLCRAEACQAAGGDALAERAEARLGAAMGTTAADGSVTLEPIYCLGLCATAPSAMIDERVVGRLDQARLDTVLAPPPPQAQDNRISPGVSSPSPRLRGEGRGEGAAPPPVIGATCAKIPTSPRKRGEVKGAFAFSFPAMRVRLRSGRMKWREHCKTRRPSAPLRLKLCEPAPAGFIGWSPWSRSRPPRGVSAMAPSLPPMPQACSMPRSRKTERIRFDTVSSMIFHGSNARRG